ncbi:MarR family transcriptional regulator [Streptomyces sp. NPDC020883]|uniref:MarR family transcriptional regulator n=1 Tax=Streptomyces sp. NPDC020883 TaxID=3365099 RepID=UPI00378DB5EF
MGRAHHRILTFLAYSPGMSVGELCDTLDLTKQAINAPLRRLIDDDLIRVAPGTKDRRRKELHLTERGADLERTCTPGSATSSTPPCNRPGNGVRTANSRRISRSQSDLPELSPARQSTSLASCPA